MKTQQDFSQTLVVIPTYNEVDNIEGILESLFQLYPSLHILVVDDNSPDKTAQVVQKWQKKNEHLHLLVRPQKMGLAGAYLQGLRWGLQRSFDYFCQMDCDYSHDPKEIAELKEKATHNDVVIGSRYIKGAKTLNWPFYRYWPSYLASLYIRAITGIPIKDPTSGFKCFKRSALEQLNMDQILSVGYIFQFEVNFRAWNRGLKIKESPIIFQDRRSGESKFNLTIMKEAFFLVLKLKFRQLLRRL